MDIRNFAKLALVAFMAAACSVQEPTENTQAPTSSEPVVSEEGVIPGVAVVEFDEATTSAIEAELAGGAVVTTKAMGSVIDQLGIIQMERVFPFAGEFEPRTRAMGLHHFYTVTFTESTPVTKATATLAAMPGVVSVSPSRPIAKRAAVFNDPKLSYQWHYINTKTAGADINVQEVWKKYTTGSNKVVVCVVDEPVDYTHEDLKDNIWTDADGHTGYNYARSSYDLSIRAQEGDSGHGTHVAGTVSAVNNNGKGLCGVAGGNKAAGVQGALLMSHVIFSGSKSASDASSARAIKEAADKGAIISQNSWGYYADANNDGKVSSQELAYYKSQTEDEVMAKAIAYFVEHAGRDANGNQLPDSPMKGGLVFFAAGNENIEYDIISANDPNVIAIGASNETGGKASYSNWGDWVDIAAPAGEGTTDSNSTWSTLPNKVSDGYGGIETTDYYGGAGWAGTSMACPHASGVAALIISYFGKQGFTAEDAKKILFGGLGSTVGGSKPIGKKIDAYASFQWALNNGYTSAEGGGQAINRAPTIKVTPETLTVPAHKVMRFTYTTTDPDGDDVTVTCEPGSAAAVFSSPAKALVITGNKAPAGNYKAEFTVTDNPKPRDASLEPMSATVSVSYTLLPNHAPEVIKSIPDQVQKNLLNLRFDAISYFKDKDGDDDFLSFKASVDNPSLADVSINGEQLVINPRGYGLMTITWTATDMLGESVSLSFKLAVVDESKPVTVENPNVTDNLDVHIDSQESTSVGAFVYNNSGTLVLYNVFTASVFYPIQLDVTSLAPGRYTAVLKYNGKTETFKFVKY